MGVIEAPRGLLYHMARVDEEGVVEDNDVIVPTAQNQIRYLENDLRDHFLSVLSGDEQRPERQPAGTLVLVRKGARRSTLALSEGFSYLTLHLRRGLLQIVPKAP
jgi:hypothetical protein